MWCGRERAVDLLQLAHQIVVDVQAARGVQDQHVHALPAGLVERVAADLHRHAHGLPVFGALVRLAVELHPRPARRLFADPARHGLELLDRRGALQVRRREHHACRAS
jgi:hypothetical protein